MAPGSAAAQSRSGDAVLPPSEPGDSSARRAQVSGIRRSMAPVWDVGIRRLKAEAEEARQLQAGMEGARCLQPGWITLIGSRLRSKMQLQMVRLGSMIHMTEAA